MRHFVITVSLGITLGGQVLPLLHADTFGNGTNEFTIDFVNVGNAGNGDNLGAGGGIHSSPYGGVAYNYRIGTYEISQDMIDKAANLGLANVVAGAWTGSQPAANISFLEAAAFVNWLNTSQGYHAAYNLSYGSGWSINPWAASEQAITGVDSGTNPYRHIASFYFLPTVDEWYKAAFHKNDGPTGNYWDYTTGSHTIPDGIDAPGDPDYEVVFNDGYSQGAPNAITNVGIKSSAYGTFGQAGNVGEWTENYSSAPFLNVVGGSWVFDARWVSAQFMGLDYPENSEVGDIGFRVASANNDGPAVILSQTVDQSAVVGTNVTFIVWAGGTAPIHYQWHKDGFDVTGATNNTLTLTNIQLIDSGGYTATASNALGLATSSEAILQVLSSGAPSTEVDGRIAVGAASVVGSAEISFVGGFPGGFIFYTKNGSVPTTSSQLYSGPFTITDSATVQAMSISSDFLQTAYTQPVFVDVFPVYFLAATVSGGGTVDLSPPGNYYPSNAVVTLTANPSEQWGFERWSGDIAGSANPISITMDGPKSVEAVFTQYLLQISVSGSGTVTADPPGPNYPSNTVVTLTAVPSQYWAFDEWAGDISTTLNPTTVTMNAPRSLQAVFRQTDFPVTVATPGGGNVTVDGQTNPPTTYYPHSSVLSIEAVTNNGWSFIEWQGTIQSTNATESLKVTGTSVAQATFGTAVSTNASGEGSIALSEPNPVPYGTLLEAYAVHEPGKYLLAWGGALSGANNPTVLHVTNPTPLISALFVSVPAGTYTINARVNGDAQVAVDPGQPYYTAGSVVMLTASTTNPATPFVGWTGDASGTQNPLTVVLTTNKVVYANFATLPIVNIEPTNLIVVAGSNGVLTANAVGMPPLHYQWQQDAGPIPGATNTTHPINNAQAGDSGDYSVIVSNIAGVVTSEAATVTVVFPPKITLNPLPQVLPADSSMTLAVLATGTAPFSYQWRKDGNPIGNATNSTCVVDPLQVADAGDYAVTVSNSYGVADSSVAHVVVYIPVEITLPPVSRVVSAYENATFSVAADGLPSPSYQWLFNSTNLPGATAATLTISNVYLPNLGEYAVVVSNPYSSQTSTPALLGMFPSIVTPYVGATAIWGLDTLLSVEAVGSGDLGYQWFKDGVVVEGGTNATLRIPAAQFSDAGLYSVVVSSFLGDVTNTPALLVINPADIGLGLYAGISITGAVGNVVGIEYSTNLADTNSWQTATNLTLQQPVQLWVDESVDALSQPKRFYRVVPGP